MGNALKEMGPSRLDDAERAFNTAIKLRTFLVFFDFIGLSTIKKYLYV